MHLSAPSDSRIVSVIPEINLRSVYSLYLFFLEVPDNYKSIFCLSRFITLGHIIEMDAPGPSVSGSHLCVAIWTDHSFWTDHIFYLGANWLFGRFPVFGDYPRCHLALPRMYQISDSNLCCNPDTAAFVRTLVENVLFLFVSFPSSLSSHTGIP